MPLADYQALVDALVRDDTDAITGTQRDGAIALAAARYAEDTGTDHTLDAGADTIPLHHREAVAAWAAAMLLDQLAARHAGDTDSTIQADGVDRGGLADRYRRLANGHRERYRKILRLDRPRAAGTVVAMDRRRAGLTHP